MLTSAPIDRSEHVSNENNPVSQAFGSGTPLQEYLACEPHVVVVVDEDEDLLGVAVDVVVGPIIPPTARVPFSYASLSCATTEG